MYVTMYFIYLHIKVNVLLLLFIVSSTFLSKFRLLKYSKLIRCWGLGQR